MSKFTLSLTSAASVTCRSLVRKFEASQCSTLGKNFIEFPTSSPKASRMDLSHTWAEVILNIAEVCNSFNLSTKGGKVYKSACVLAGAYEPP